MIELTEQTYQIRIYMSGPVEFAKQAIREYVMCGLCVTVEPTTYIYTGGEEVGFVVGLLNYPRFPSAPQKLMEHAKNLAIFLLERTFQHSALIVTSEETTWMTKRETPK